MTVDTLGERLRSMVLDSPDTGRVTARVLSPSSRKRRPPLRIGLAPLAFAILCVAIAYFVPSAGTVIAKVPVAGGMLGVNGHITTVGSSATSSGYTLTLVAAYADSTRTVIQLHTSPAAALLGPDAHITDQFGRSYGSSNASGDLLTGDMTAQFQPLAWPDGITGARITLEVNELETGVDPRVGVVNGTWKVYATLGVDEGTSVAVPASGSLGSAHFTFTSVIYTPATIAIDMDMTGVSDQELTRPVPNGTAKPTPALIIDVLDATGTSVANNIEIDDGFFGVSRVHLIANRDDIGHGVYTVRVTYLGRSFNRTVNVS
jgi:hypothetical protein